MGPATGRSVDPEVDAQQLEYIRAELRNGHTPLPDAVAQRLAVGSLFSERTGKQYLPDHGVSKPVWKTSSEVDANTSPLDLARPEGPVWIEERDEQGRFVSKNKNPAGAEPADESPASEGQESLPAERQSTPSAVRVKVGNQDLDLTPDQIADAWKTSRKAKELEAQAEQALKYAQLRGAAANAFLDRYESASDEERAEFDRLMAGGSSRRQKTPPPEPAEETDEDEEPETPARRASPPALPPDYQTLKAQVRQMREKLEQREAAEQRAYAAQTVESLMGKHEIFKDPVVRKLALRGINSDLSADPNADVESLVAGYAADAAALAKSERQADMTGGKTGPAALGGQPGTPSKPLTGADLKSGAVAARAEARLRGLLR